MRCAHPKKCIQFHSLFYYNNNSFYKDAFTFTFCNSLKNSCTTSWSYRGAHTNFQGCARVVKKFWGKSRPSTATDYYCSFSIWYHQKERDLIVVGRKTNFRLLWLEWLPFFAFIIKQTENLKFKVSRPKMRSPLCTLRQNCTFCTKLILFYARLQFLIFGAKGQKKKKSTFLYFLYFILVWLLRE